MKILITGGLGYIGSVLNIDGDILDANLYNKELSISRFEEIDPRIEYDAVVHLADYRLQDYNKDLVKENVENNKRFLEHVRSDRLIYASSCSVYGFQRGICDEISTPNPTSYYAESKLEVEDLIRTCVPYHCVLRFGTAHGDSPCMRTDLLINAMRKAIKDGTPFDIYSMEAVRPYIHVQDIAAGIKFCIENNITGTYNLSTENLKVKEVIQRLPETDVFKHTPELAAFNEDKRNYAVSSKKINQLGFTPGIKI